MILEQRSSVSRCGMVKNARTPARREDSLSRERIVDAAIELLDSAGEGGLTFRALSDKLATGPGAIYWHVANKGDLLVAACDAVVSATMDACPDGGTPGDTLRALALGMFDAMDTHPWIGSALIQSAGQLPAVRLFERIGRQVQALGVPREGQWGAASTLLHYVLGVGGQNAANRLSARTRDLDRDDFLGEVADAWAGLEEADYPFMRSVAAQMRDHDDRADFLAGVDLILAGIQAGAGRGARATGSLSR